MCDYRHSSSGREFCQQVRPAAHLLAPDHQNVFDHLGMYKESVLSNAAQILAYEIVAKAKGGWTYEEMAIDDSKELACKVEAEALIPELNQGLEVGI